MSRYAHLAYTESVLRAQRENGSALVGIRALAQEDRPDLLGPDEAAFIESRDGFYLASVSETGWPYVQFRGGPPGFVHVLDERTMAFIDVRGNRQYITVGNVQADGRVALFFMDYPHRARLKVFGHPGPVPFEENGELARRLGGRRTAGGRSAWWSSASRVSTGTAPSTSPPGSPGRSRSRHSKPFARASPHWRRRTRPCVPGSPGACEAARRTVVRTAASPPSAGPAGTARRCARASR